MHPRSVGAANLHNPLAANTYDSIEQAMREFLRIYLHPLSADNLALVRQHLIEHDLARIAVRDLALELSGLFTQQLEAAE